MFKRFREKRKDKETRLKYQEIFLKKDDFVYTVFLLNGKKRKEQVLSMKNIYRMSIDVALEEIKILYDSGLRSILLFGIPDTKGINQALREDGIIPVAIKEIKNKFKDLQIITDVCLCSYTEDGHCEYKNNDETCEILAEISLLHAKAGVDIVAPSDMMDGRVYFIRKKLKENGFLNLPILSYSSKFASNFYGPFRDAAYSKPAYGDRKTYQLNYANLKEALEEIEEDLKEGATYIMLKPALSYLDVINKAKQKFPDIIFYAYNVSGEYSMINYLIEQNLAKEEIIYEILLSIKRAGADKIVSYFTPWILEKIDEYQSL